jgi:sulfur-carrier protein
MPRIMLTGPIKQAAGGIAELDIEATNIREMLARLGERIPELAPMLEKGVAVSVDGRIYRGAFLQPIKPDSEVFILPQLVGG